MRLGLEPAPCAPATGTQAHERLERGPVTASVLEGMVLQPGAPWPLGASCTATGVNFAVASGSASAVHLCLYDDDGRDELARVALGDRTGDVFHVHVDGLRAGQVYGLRCEGRWAPGEGQRFNPAKLLLDPYAREIVGRFAWSDEHRGGDLNAPERPDRRDNGPRALKARVVGPEPHDWTGDRPPRTPLAETVMYELHVKGYTRCHPAVPAALRGTYAGLAHPAVIAHLRSLGVTAVELLPVHQHLDEERLVGMGLVNYWGYNTLGFFCPEPGLAHATEPEAIRAEFRDMVKALHAAGIEVLLDVVFNHTAEGDETGPTISWRGIDNAGCYRLEADRPDRYENHTGCGNTVDLRRPRMLQFVMDCLRHWVGEMHVDGFRFDLATVLGRGDAGYDPRAAFFQAVAQDPLLAGTKLIAEPWDIGPGGYQLGRFPVDWAEWNDRFRDELRAFWLRGGNGRGALARRLCASSDVFGHDGRAPAASVNYIVSHDGFTLRDLVSYAERHNLANGENNRDGTGNNLSTHCGVEGPSDDPAVLQRRARLARALLACNLLAQGTPLLSQGDELGHTQQGNNNPYCQDNPTTWIDWSATDTDLLAFTRHVVALRHRLLPFADRWYPPEGGRNGLAWTDSDGSALHDAAWNDGARRALGCFICRPGRGAEPLMLIVNGGESALDFTLPEGTWNALLDTTLPRGGAGAPWAAGPTYPLAALSLALLVAST